MGGWRVDGFHLQRFCYSSLLSSVAVVCSRPLLYNVPLFEKNIVYLLIDSISGYLGCFRFLYLWKYIAMIILVHVFLVHVRTHLGYLAGSVSRACDPDFRIVSSRPTLGLDPI